MLVTFFLSLSAFASNFQFQRLGSSSGIPSLQINKIIQQENGFIWMASDSGVSRFDGARYRHYSHNPDSDRSLSNNFVTDIVEDANSDIWFATESGLNRLKKDGSIQQYFHHPDNEKSLYSDWVLDLFLDDNSQLWIGTGGGLNLYIPESDDFQRIPLLIEDKQDNSAAAIYSIQDDLQGRLFIGTDFGLALLDKDRKRISTFDDKQPFLSSYVTTIYRDQLGKVWFGTENYGVFSIMPKSIDFKQEFYQGETIKFLEKNTVNRIIETRSNKMLFAHNRGVTVLDQNTGELTHLKREDFNSLSLPSSNVLDIMIDQTGSIWIATDRGIAYNSILRNGVHVHQQKPHKNGLSGEEVYSVYSSDNDKLWLGTDQGVALYKLKKSTFQDIKLQSTNALTWATSEVFDMDADHQGNLWLAHKNGLSYLNSDTLEVTHFTQNVEDRNKWTLPQTEYYTVLSDGKNGVWYTTYYGNGLTHFDPKKGITNKFLDDDNNQYTIGGNYSSDSVLNAKGEIWLATTDSIFRVNPISKKTYHYRLGEKNNTIRATGISIDKNDTIWVTTNGLGLVRIQSKDEHSDEIKIDYLNEALGIKDSILKSVILDKNNRVWFTSKKGLYVYDQENKQTRYFKSLISDQDLDFYDASITIFENNLYVGSTKGLVTINTDKILGNASHPQVHITSLAYGAENYRFTGFEESPEIIELPYVNNDIIFNFSVTDFAQAAHNRFQYKLEGYDERWNSLSNSRHASYGNLMFGNYTFKVRATNSDGMLSQNEASVKINIARPWWFYVLIISIMSSLLLMFFIYRNRNKNLKILHHRANHDSLTGLANRESFHVSLAKRCTGKNNLFAVLFIDIDHFKVVNDTFGHSIGDDLIISIGKKLSQCLKDTDILARLSGDEFAIIVGGYKTSHNLNNIINRILSNLRSGFQIDEHWIHSSASIGVARFPKDGATPQTLLKNADTAMYAAKQDGRNKSHYFSHRLSKELAEQLYISSQLKNSFLDNEFEVFYQPKICCQTREVRGFEALVRWNNPERGYIPPSLFIPEAEKNGFILQLGEWVLRESICAAADWYKEGKLKESLAVNLSVMQLSQTNLVEYIASILEEFGLPPNRLEIEITESICIANIDLAKSVLSSIRDIGVKIALDDFGAGYSSLNYLTQLPIDTLKIDRNFLINVEQNKRSLLILKNIFRLARDLGLYVVAEGVETEEQFQLVKQYQCHLVQGFLFSPAVPLNMASDLICNRT